MAKKKLSKNPDSQIGYNGTPFTKEQYDHIALQMSSSKETAFVWAVFNEYYSSTIRLAYRELLETQKFFIGLLGEARTKFGTVEESSDIDLAEEMTKWVKSLQSISDGILSMRNTMLSATQAIEIESSVNDKSSTMSLIDEMAISSRKTDKHS
jgi:hypothetical protein